MTLPGTSPSGLGLPGMTVKRQSRASPLVADPSIKGFYSTIIIIIIIIIVQCGQG